MGTCKSDQFIGDFPMELLLYRTDSTTAKQSFLPYTAVHTHYSIQTHTHTGTTQYRGIERGHSGSQGVSPVCKQKKTAKGLSPFSSQLINIYPVAPERDKM